MASEQLHIFYLNMDVFNMDITVTHIKNIFTKINSTSLALLKKQFYYKRITKNNTQ